jgi:hypothetical protein
MSEFIFIGYLIQEPYWKAWPKRDGYRVASIEREFHPQYNKHQWNQVQGIENPTRFLTQFPQLEELSLEPHQCQSVLHKQSPGWVVSGYAVPREVAEQPRTITIGGREATLYDFRYATRMRRNGDDLKLLGYEVVDEDDLFLSILNNCGYTVDQVREMAGPLNEYSLLSSREDAERFKEAIKTDPNNPKIIPDHNRGLIVQVWGQR